MDSGGIGDTGGFSNGGFSSNGDGGFSNSGFSVDCTSQATTIPSFDQTCANTENVTAITHVESPPVSPEWATMQQAHHSGAVNHHQLNHSGAMNHHQSIAHGMPHHHNMAAAEPKNDYQQPREPPPVYYPSGLPQGPPPAYYAPPMYMYPNQQQYLQQYPPQQQQHVTVVGMPQNTPVFVQQAPYQSYCGHIVLACVTFWFCGVLFGLIAFILAVVADSNKRTDANGARQLGRASLGVSIAGLVVGVVLYIAIGVAVGVTTNCHSRNGYPYSYSYMC